MDVDITRRRLLVAGGGLTGLSALGIGTRHWLRSPDAPKPAVPVDDLRTNGWERTDESIDTADVGSVGPFTFTAQTHMLQFQRPASDGAASVRSTSSDDEFEEVITLPVEMPTHLFTARGISMSPQAFDLPGGQIKTAARTAARQDVLIQFTAQLERLGFQLPEESDDTATGERTNESAESDDRGAENDTSNGGSDIRTLETRDGYTADLLEFEVTYPLPRTGVQISEEETISLPSTAIPVTCQVALWQPSSYFMSVGSAYPARSISWDRLEEESDGEDEFEVDLDLSPEQTEAEITAYMQKIGR